MQKTVLTVLAGRWKWLIDRLMCGFVLYSVLIILGVIVGCILQWVLHSWQKLLTHLFYCAVFYVSQQLF